MKTRIKESLIFLLGWGGYKKFSWKFLLLIQIQLLLVRDVIAKKRTGQVCLPGSFGYFFLFVLHAFSGRLHTCDLVDRESEDALRQDVRNGVASLAPYECIGCSDIE